MGRDDFLRKAIAEARKCVPSETAFSVGAVIVKNGNVISKGFSRESPGKHAEESAIEKAVVPLEGAILYSTMESCSIRSSGTPCTEIIIKSGISRVVFGINEPDTFVDCRGVEILTKAGVDVVRLEGMEKECKEPNTHLLKKE